MKIFIQQSLFVLILLFWWLLSKPIRLFMIICQEHMYTYIQKDSVG